MVWLRKNAGKGKGQRSKPEKPSCFETTAYRFNYSGRACALSLLFLCQFNPPERRTTVQLEQQFTDLFRCSSSCWGGRAQRCKWMLPLWKRPGRAAHNINKHITDKRCLSVLQLFSDFQFCPFRACGEFSVLCIWKGFVWNVALRWPEYVLLD